mmetsp:Transcript_30303/g.77010  ORF Transcript_30303/g.77010 Transcript_30303/m.77010 type:complete len:215 (+) Transcript_30303:1694-2338(+)
MARASCSALMPPSNCLSVTRAKPRRWCACACFRLSPSFSKMSRALRAKPTASVQDFFWIRSSASVRQATPSIFWSPRSRYAASASLPCRTPTSWFLSPRLANVSPARESSMAACPFLSSFRWKLAHSSSAMRVASNGLLFSKTSTWRMASMTRRSESDMPAASPRRRKMARACCPARRASSKSSSSSRCPSAMEKSSAASRFSSACLLSSAMAL